METVFFIFVYDVAGAGIFFDQSVELGEDAEVLGPRPHRHQKISIEIPKGFGLKHPVILKLRSTCFGHGLGY